MSDRPSRWDTPSTSAAAAAAAPASTSTSGPVSAADAATAAAAIAAKIAASLQPSGGELVLRAPEEGDYVKDIDINDLRNRYVLTRVQTQKQVSVDVG